MSNTVDTRVVEAKFDNAQFQRGVKETVSSLDNLKRGLNMDGAARGLSTLSSAASTVANRFSVMRVAAYTAIATIAHQATIAAEQFVKSFTVGPLLDGLHEYETQLNSVQTILSNTQWEHKNLDDVNKALNELNHYSDKTIYNFSEMARNVGTFTAAGVKLNTSVASIKGIANLAAVSGSNSQQAATAMYQLSQAISSGTVKLMDWNSVVNAGMGGKVFQDALIRTAKVHGVAVDDMIKKEGSFRNTLQNGWLTSKILTETLNTFTGDMSKAQLKQIGYTDAQIKDILKMGKTATDAATKVKTFTQLMGTLREAAGSGWAKTWQIIIGNFNQAKQVWTSVSNVLGGMIQSAAKARNNVLKDWAALGGRQAMIDGISNAFKALMSILAPIKDAFREIFPAKTGQQLADMTKSFRDFMKNLKIGADTADVLKRTFAGVFAVLDIGWQVIKAGVKFISDLFGAITEGEGSGGFLGATANIGDFLVALDQAIKKGQGLTKFFQGLEHILAGPIALIKALAHALFGLFDFGGKTSPEQITHAVEPLGTMGTFILNVWDKVISVLDNVFHWFLNLGSKLAGFFGQVSQGIAGMFQNINYDQLLSTVNTGLFAGLVLLFKKFVSNFGKQESSFSGIVEAIKAPFGELTNTLQSMQQTLRATTLLQIAAAVGILAASVVALSYIDAEGLTRALTAITVMFGQLFVALVLFEKVGGAKGLSTTAAGLIVFATAIRVLTSSVKALAELSWNDLVKGLVGVTTLIGGLVLATQGLNTEAAGMIRAGAGLTVLAVALRILVNAVSTMAELSWGQMSKGLTGIATLLTSLTLFTKFSEVNKGGLAQGAGLLLLATAIKVLASAVSDMGSISWGGLVKGLGSVIVVLGTFVAFTKTIGKSGGLISSGVALIAISTALNVLAKALQAFASMSWGQIAKGMTVLGGSMIILVVAMAAMESSVGGAVSMLIVSAALVVLGKALASFASLSWGEIAKAGTVLLGALTLIALAAAAMIEALPGAAAMLVMAAALRILAPVLVTMGSMSWGEIAKGMIVLAGAFTIIGIAAALLTPIIPSLLGLGAAIALLGAGVALIGGGLALLGVGITAIAASAGAAAIGITAFVSALVGMIPTVAKQLALGVMAFAQTIAKAGPAIVKALVTILDSLLDAVIKEAPKIAKALGVLLDNMLKLMRHAVPEVADTALDMIVGILHAIADHAPKIVNQISRMLIDILDAMANKADDLVVAGGNLMLAVLKGIGKNIENFIDTGVHIVARIIRGIGNAADRLVDVAAQTLLTFLHALADDIRLYEPELMAAGWDIAKAIAEGFWNGLKGGLGGMFGKVAGLFGGVVGVAYDVYDMHSPSKVFEKIGRYVAYGFRNGLVGGWADVQASFQKLLGMFKDTVSNLNNELESQHQNLKQLTQDHRDLKKAINDDNQAVDDAQNKLNKLLNAKKLDHDAITQAKQDLKDAKDARDEDTKALADNEDQQKKIQKQIDKTSTALEHAHSARDELVNKIAQEGDALRTLGKQYDLYQTKLDAANQALTDAIQLRDNYKQQITDQYSKLPDVQGVGSGGSLPDIQDTTTLDDYTKSVTDQTNSIVDFTTALATLKSMGLNDDQYEYFLSKGPVALTLMNDIIKRGANAITEVNNLGTSFATAADTLGAASATTLDQYTQGIVDQIDSTVAYTQALDELRAMGLNDAQYAKFVSEGPKDMPLVQAIIAGGQEAVNQVNWLSSVLSAAAEQLGTDASTSLYQAGVDASQAIVDGLEQNITAIEKEMKKIAHIIVKTIKDELDIKSPSRVLRDLAVKAGNGIVAGLSDSGGTVKRATKDLGDKMVSNMSTAVERMRSLIDETMDLNPTVRPIVDLSDIHNANSDLQSILSNTVPFNISASQRNAISASAGYHANLSDAISEQVASVGVRDGITFIQNNNSPKALSDVTIYRQTKNQLSKVKGGSV